MYLNRLETNSLDASIDARMSLYIRVSETNARVYTSARTYVRVYVHLCIRGIAHKVHD